MMERAAVLARAQAKINLVLRVGPREDDGYHTLDTLFARLDLSDEVIVRVGGRQRVATVRGADIGPIAENLALRAALAYSDAVGWPEGFQIDLVKHIPIGAGLGGGSADAAAVLRALNALAPDPLPPAELLAVAAGLGADVPFLASDHVMALGTGYGERLQPVAPLPRRPITLLIFPFGISTPDAYRWLDASRTAAPPTRASVSPGDVRTWDLVERLAENDLEAPVVARHAAIGEVLDRLHRAGIRLARMSGSGSTVFAAAESRACLDALGGAAVTPIATWSATSVVAVERLE